jgi:hypothetical protein
MAPSVSSSHFFILGIYLDKLKSPILTIPSLFKKMLSGLKSL